MIGETGVLRQGRQNSIQRHTAARTSHWYKLNKLTRLDGADVIRQSLDRILSLSARWYKRGRVSIHAVRGTTLATTDTTIESY